MAVRVQISVNLIPLLTALLVGLKLGHVIDWPWIWVLSPLWISACVVLFRLGVSVADIALGRR
jgi:hypothetical protein